MQDGHALAHRRTRYLCDFDGDESQRGDLLEIRLEHVMLTVSKTAFLRPSLSTSNSTKYCDYSCGHGESLDMLVPSDKIFATYYIPKHIFLINPPCIPSFVLPCI